MRWCRRLLLACLLAGLLGSASGCVASRQQRYREHLGMTIKPSKDPFGGLFATADTDNP
jgi:hypothetical protein